MSISGTIAAMHGYAQPAKLQSANREGSVAAYTCMAQREPSVGVANRNTEVICAGMTSGAIVLWRFPKTQRVGNLPPPPHTIAPPLILGVHRAAVTALAFFDDTILVSGSHDCCLCLWDVNMQFIATEAPGFKAGSRCVQSVVAHNATVSHVAVHGPWIVSAGSTDGTIKVWGCARPSATRSRACRST